MAQTVKNPPAMQETQVGSVGREDLLEKGITAPSRILAWRIPWTEEPGGLQSVGLQTVGHDCVTNTHKAASVQEDMIEFGDNSLYKGLG